MFNLRIQYPLLLIFLLVSFLLPVHTDNAYGEPLETVTLQLKWQHQFQFAGFYAAIEKGYYRDAGLRVLLKEATPGMKLSQEVVSGRAEYGIDKPGLLLDRQRGLPVVVLAAIFQHSPEALFVRKDSGINTPHDLLGKTVMLSPYGAVESRAMFLNEMLPVEKLKVIEHSWNLDDLLENRVDAMEGYVTDRPYLAKERGVTISALRPLMYGVDFYGDCLFTSEEEINQHPERVKAFLTASFKGWQYAMAHPQELVDLILQKYSTRLSREALLYEAEVMKELLLPRLVKIGQMNPGRWEHIADTLVQLGMLSPGYSLEGFLYDPERRVDYKKVLRLAWLLATVALVIASAVVLLFYFNRKLNRQVAERTAHLQREIAERKRSDEERLALISQLRQAQKMEAIGTLAGGIAHDFNNILAAISGYAELASRKIDEPDKVRRYLGEILAGTGRATELVRQILAFSRKAEQDLQPIHLQAVVEETLRLLRVTLPSTIEINQQVDPDCGPILADPTEIHQVIMNLCSNASHAMQETGGTLTVAVQRRHLEDPLPGENRILPPGDYLQVEISDTGRGMSAAILNRIFEPYFTTKEKGEGTGLGLAVAHGIVTRLSGDIKVQSELGKGTSFFLYFPTIATTGKLVPEVTHGPPPTGKGHILLVDDDWAIVEMGQHMLQSLGYQVTACTDSMDCLQLFQQQPEHFDLIITDMTMPKLTGADLAAKVLKIRPAMPIILSTGFSEQIDEKGAKAIGISAYLMKPVLLHELAQTVQSVLSNDVK